MTKIIFVLILCVNSIFAGFNSANMIFNNTTLDYKHQFVGTPEIGNALGWLEISPKTRQEITLSVAPFHLQIIQPIWSIDKDRNSKLSSFGILNHSSFLVRFHSTYHDLNFSSISTISPYSISAGVFQQDFSHFLFKGKFDFYSIGNSGIGGETYGFFGGMFTLENAQITFSAIDSDFSNAYGIKAEVNLDKNSQIIIKEISARDQAYGIVGDKLGGGKISIQSITSKQDYAYGFLGSLKEGEIAIGNISGKNVYGVYTSSPATIEGVLKIDSLSAKEKSYGIYNSSLLQIQNSNLSFASLKAGESSIAIFSNGKLDISSSSLSFTSTPTNAIISLLQTDLVLFDTSLSSQDQLGIHSSNSSKITVLQNGILKIDTPLEALSGNLSLLLQDGASFESLQSGATLQALTTQNKAKISLWDPYSKLSIADFDANHSIFSLKATPQSNAMIEIQGTTSSQILENELYIALEAINLTPTQTILAKLPSSLGDSMVFNSLYENNQSIKSISYVGFDEAEIMITREEKDGFILYTTDLVAINHKVNPIFFFPTSMALNANHTLFLLESNSFHARLEELRSDSKRHGLWGRAKTGRGQESFEQNSQVSYFVAQGGYDFRFCSIDSCNVLGIFGSYLRGVSEQDANTAFTQGAEIGIYHGYIADNGLFWDSALKSGTLFSEVDIIYNLHSQELQNYSFSFSQELGYRWGEKKGIYLEPKAQISLSYLTPQSFTQTMQLQSNLYTLFSEQKALWDLRGKIGAKIGYLFGSMIEGVELGIGGFYILDIFSGGEMILHTQNSSQILSPYTTNQQGLLSLSLQVFLQEDSNLAFEFEKSFGGHLTQEFALNFSLRFSFGQMPTSIPPNSSQVPLRTQEELSMYKSHSLSQQSL